MPDLGSTAKFAIAAAATATEARLSVGGAAEATMARVAEMLRKIGLAAMTTDSCPGYC